MIKQRKIINTNIRLNLIDVADREAWEHLQRLDRKQYKSYSRAVVAALNDYFGRQEQLAADPYLETRIKEDAFLERVLDAVEKGAKESMPMVLVGNLVQLLQPVMRQQANPDPSPILSLPYSDRDAIGEHVAQHEQEAAEAAALDFADGF